MWPHIDIHEFILCVTSKTVPGWTPRSACSGLQVPDIIFEIRIEMLDLTSLYLDIPEVILRETSKSVNNWPPRSAPSSLQEPDIIFDIRNEILALTNL